jgi:F-box and WD-40 domain protein CDC4
LEGHDHAVRALAARGRTLVSGSYDCSVRIWDTITGACKWVLVGHTQKGVLINLHISGLNLLDPLVYSVVLDPTRNQACSGSMDGTVRVWNLLNGQCQHTLTGHTSLVGLLGLSPSHLVSAAADSTLRIWDPETGELRHTLAAHTGAITCFQHDEFKVLSGSDGNLKMWNVRDGTIVRDLLTGITGVWQVVFEGRWCVAASNRSDATVLDVWDFGNEEDEDWIGEPSGGMYDEDGFSEAEDEDEDELGTARILRMTAPDEDDDDEQEQADVDAMDQDLLLPSDTESVDIDIDEEEHSRRRRHRTRGRGEAVDIDDAELMTESMDRRSEGVEASRWAPSTTVSTTTTSSSRLQPSQMGRLPRAGGAPVASSSRRTAFGATGVAAPSLTLGQRTLPANDETPTRPRVRGSRRR